MYLYLYLEHDLFLSKQRSYEFLGVSVHIIYRESRTLCPLLLSLLLAFPLRTPCEYFPSLSFLG